jgi:hypothetical protein
MDVPTSPEVAQIAVAASYVWPDPRIVNILRTGSARFAKRTLVPLTPPVIGVNPHFCIEGELGRSLCDEERGARPVGGLRARLLAVDQGAHLKGPALSRADACFRVAPALSRRRSPPTFSCELVGNRTRDPRRPRSGNAEAVR